MMRNKSGNLGCCWYNPPCQHMRMLMDTTLIHKRLAQIEEARLAEETNTRVQKNKDPDNPENDAMQSDSKRSKSGECKSADQSGDGKSTA